jgi:hypothetical protein
VVHDLAYTDELDDDFKKPIIGARFLISLEMKIIRIVPRLISQIRAKNIRIGRIT